MPERPEIWLLVHDEELVAELAVERDDQPWLSGTVTRRERFEILAPLLAPGARVTATIGITPERAAYQGVRHPITLVRPNGHEAPDFILHIDGSQARWRPIEPIAEPLPEAKP